MLFRSVVDYALYMLDQQGRVASWNAGAERIKGYAAREIIGEHFSHFYTEEDRRIMRLIANRVAASIENARLYRRLDRQNRTLKTLASVSQEFSSILDLDELLGKIAGSLRGLIYYDAFSIYLVDAEKQLLRHRFSVRYDQRVNLDNIPLGKGITGASAGARAPVRVQDTAKDPRYIASHPDIR